MLKTNKLLMLLNKRPSTFIILPPVLPQGNKTLHDICIFNTYAHIYLYVVRFSVIYFEKCFMTNNTNIGYLYTVPKLNIYIYIIYV